MKVALSYPDCSRIGGIERVIYECAKYLSGRGHDVTVFANRYEPSEAKVIYRHVAIPAMLKPLEHAVFHRACKRALHEGDFDVHGSFGLGCPEGGVYWAGSVHAAWLRRAKVLRPPWSVARWKQSFNPTHALLLSLEKRHLRRGGYRGIIALTEEMKADLHFHYGVPPEDVDVLPGGYAPQEFNLERSHELRERMRKELNFAPDDKVVIFVANELNRKGYPALLRAMELMGDPRLRLLVAGRMAPRPHPLVTYVGSAVDVTRYYAAADVFALPTLYEAWGLVIIEAMATGLPVLTSRLAGAAVAVREGETGNLLDVPTDESEIARKLRPLVEGRHSSPEEISASVAPYAWDRVLVKYEQILCKMKH